MLIDKDAIAKFIGWMGELTKQTPCLTGVSATATLPPTLQPQE